MRLAELSLVFMKLVLSLTFQPGNSSILSIRDGLGKDTFTDPALAALYLMPGSMSRLPSAPLSGSGLDMDPGMRKDCNQGRISHCADISANADYRSALCYALLFDG